MSSLLLLQEFQHQITSNIRLKIQSSQTLLSQKHPCLGGLLASSGSSPSISGYFHLKPHFIQSLNFSLFFIAFHLSNSTACSSALFALYVGPTQHRKNMLTQHHAYGSPRFRCSPSMTPLNDIQLSQSPIRTHNTIQPTGTNTAIKIICRYQ